VVVASDFLGSLLFLVPFLGLSSGLGEKYQRQQSLALSAYVLERQYEKAYTRIKPYGFLGREHIRSLRFVLSVSV